MSSLKRNSNPYKSGGSSVHSSLQHIPYDNQQEEDDDDDFEKQYIVSGPSPPVQFKSANPVTQQHRDEEATFSSYQNVAEAIQHVNVVSEQFSIGGVDVEQQQQ